MHSENDPAHGTPASQRSRKLIFLGVFLVLAVVTAYAAFTWTRSFFQDWVITDLGSGFQFNKPMATETAGEVVVNTPAPGEPTTTPPPNISPGEWQGADRITILVMGLDYRDWEIGEGAPRTDTMVLLTLDPLSKTAGLLSIPRDLYVPIPGFQYQRINVAYRFGEIYEIPGGGPALATRTVEQLLGVPIDYYAQVDFYTFVKMIDEIGGLKIDVQETIVVDPLGKGNKKTLKPGRQTLPGDVALAYARARNTEGGDFDRAQRTQQVILAIRDRILEFNLIPTLIAKAPVLYQELSSGVNTNMTLEQALQIGWLAKDIPTESIKRGVISTEEIVFVLSPEGDQVLKPLPDKIRLLRDEVFGTANLTSPLSALDQAARVQAEGAVVTMYNGTFVDKLARNTADYLAPMGLTIPDERLAGATIAYPYTTVVDYTGNPYTVQLLVDALGINYSRIFLQYDVNSSVDVEVYLGNDWANSGKLP